MLFDFRIKRAQVALADGRLDEAFELLKSPSLTEHRSGQKLITRLSKEYVRRGQQHLETKHLAPALEDCLRAEKLAGNQPEIEQLRTRIARQIESERLEAQQRAEQFAKAKLQIQNGWLSTGRKILAETDDKQARYLMQQAETLDHEKKSAVNRIQEALKHTQIELAADIFRSSPLHKSKDPKAVEILGHIQKQACQKIKDDLLEGRIYQASVFLKQLNGQVSQCESLYPYQQVIEYSYQAAQHIDTGEYERAIIHLRKIQSILTKAKWVSELTQLAQKAAEAKQELQTSPLGILEKGAFSEIPDIIATPRKVEHHIPEPIQAVCGRHFKRTAAKMRFILQIDGVGAYYVFGDTCVTIGPVSSSIHSDIELVTAPDVRPRQIERIEDDYFLGEIQHGHSVNPSAKQLLQDGDLVELSKRCRFKFAVSNPASNTACLVPSSARFPRADISGVILMAREILIGPERNCHVQTGQIPEAITLFSQDGRIRCRASHPIYADGRPLARDHALPVNKQIEIGDSRFMLIVHETFEG